MPNSELEALKRAVRTAGGQADLAKAISSPGRVVRPQHVWNWLHREKRAAHWAVLDIERATQVSRHELRADIYPRERAA